MTKLSRKLKRRQKKVGKRYKPSALTNAISRTFKRTALERHVIGENIRWYVLRTSVKAERLVALRLIDAGVEPFLPTFVEQVNRKDRRTGREVISDVERHLMPRYLFAGLRHGDPRELVRSTDGVEAVLSFRGEPVTVPPKALQRIADILTGHDEEVQPVVDERALVVGSKARVVSGPFAQFHAVIEEVISTGRIMALVDIFGRLTPVEFDLAQLESL